MTPVQAKKFANSVLLGGMSFEDITILMHLGNTSDENHRHSANL
jgi:hypothetical protein